MVKVNKKEFLRMLFALLAFSIPLVPKLLPLLILSLFFTVLSKYGRQVTTLFRDRSSLLFLALYSLFIISSFYSSHRPESLFDLQVKLSLLIFPFVFLVKEDVDFVPQVQPLIWQSFIQGCLLSFVLTLVTAVLRYIQSANPNYFFYSDLSVLFHPSYLSMYYCWAILLLLNDYNNGFFLSARWNLVWIGLLLTGIVMLASKAGIFSLTMIAVFYLIKRIRKEGVQWKWMFAAILFLALLGTVAAGSDKLKGRFEEFAELFSSKGNVNKATGNSTAVRFLVWKESAGIIKQHFFTGVGNGDVKASLMEAYREHDLKGALAKGLNAHNQFLQTFISVGVGGFLILMVLLFMPMSALYSHPFGFYKFAFLCLMAVNFMFESMLETQAGVVFFAFFYCLLFCFSGKKG